MKAKLRYVPLIFSIVLIIGSIAYFTIIEQRRIKLFCEDLSPGMSSVEVYKVLEQYGPYQAFEDKSLGNKELHVRIIFENTLTSPLLWRSATLYFNQDHYIGGVNI